MKKPLLLAVLALAIFASCEKQAPSGNMDSEKSAEATSISTFKKLKDVQDQRLAYPLLTVDEQKLILLDHLHFCLSYFDFTEDQRDLIHYAIDHADAILSENAETTQTMNYIEATRKTVFSSMPERDVALIFTTFIDNAEDANLYISNGSLADK